MSQFIVSAQRRKRFHFYFDNLVLGIANRLCAVVPFIITSYRARIIIQRFLIKKFFCIFFIYIFAA